MRNSSDRGLYNQTRRELKSTDTINYSLLNKAARERALELCRRLLPHGRVCGREYEALNPKRDDRSLGSFRINLVKGKWADFATGDAGGDFVSLVAYLLDLPQSKAALHLSALLNVDVEGRS